MPVTDLYYKATHLEKILDLVHMEFQVTHQTHYTEELPLFHKVANSVLNPVFPEFTLLVLQFSAYLFPPPGALGV